ncbi:MAG: amidohydrolase family protein, partial [Pseudomonadota bacterium]
MTKLVDKMLLRIRVIATWCSLIPLMSLATACASSTPQGDDADLVISGGMVYPGAAAPYIGDVAIRGDRIVYVGKRAPMPAGKVIDARGLIVAPGFIDPHTHIDAALVSEDPKSRLVLPFLMQGVTTAFIGVDGSGDPTLINRGALRSRDANTTHTDIGVNVASYVGLGPVRQRVVGLKRLAPTPVELSTMTNLVQSAMCRGALGLSTGLFYAPQSFAQRDEVVALAKAAATYGGVYDTHIRDESSYSIGLKAAIKEALEIGSGANIPVHIAHIKALGVDVHGQASEVVSIIETAREAGQVVHADQYPWTASATGLSAALIPRWAQDGGREAMLERFDDVAVMEKMRPEIIDNLRRRGGPDSILITAGPDFVEGKTLEDISNEAGEEAIDVAIAILRTSEAAIASFNQTEADIATFMRQPWVVTGSDASRGHPRYFGSYARKYAVYVRERKVLDLRTFIKRSSTATAKMFDLKDRGELKIGAFADVIAFDPDTFAARADYANPERLATGMQFVVINGKLAVEDGKATGL